MDDQKFDKEYEYAIKTVFGKIPEALFMHMHPITLKVTKRCTLPCRLILKNTIKCKAMKPVAHIKVTVCYHRIIDIQTAQLSIIGDTCKQVSPGDDLPRAQSANPSPACPSPATRNVPEAQQQVNARMRSVFHIATMRSYQ